MLLSRGCSKRLDGDRTDVNPNFTAVIKDFIKVHAQIVTHDDLDMGRPEAKHYCAAETFAVQIK